MKHFFVVLFMPAFLLSCKDEDDPHYDRTPAGFTARWVTLRQPDKWALYAEFDVAVLRAENELLRDHGIPKSATRTKAYGIIFEFYDHIFFQTQVGPATGAYWPVRHPEIWLAYWPFEIAPDEATATALGLWREWRGPKLEPGQEWAVPLEPRLGLGRVDDAVFWYVVHFFGEVSP